MIKFVVAVGFLLSIPFLVLLSLYTVSKDLDEHYFELDEFDSNEYDI